MNIVTTAQDTTIEERSEHSISIVIPTYNERGNIGSVLDRCTAALAGSGYQYELIVVDDDSPDRTWKYVEEEYANDDHVRVLRRTKNKGLALSVAAGFREAAMDYCAVIDGDLQHPPEKVPELLAALDDGADLAIGSRHTKDGQIENWTWFRRFVSKGATTLARASIPTARGLSDPMSGLFAIRRSLVKDVNLDPQGYKILLEILSKCNVGRIEEVPYVFREREAGESKLTAGQYQQFAEHALELSIREYAAMIGEHPRRIVRIIEFFAVGAVGVLVNAVVFSIVVSAGLHYLLAGGAAFLAAVQWNFLGNWAITFDRPKNAILQRYIAFHAVCAIGLLIYEVALTLFVQISFVPLMAANIGAIGVTSIWNFIGSDTTAFAESFGRGESSVQATNSATQREQKTVDE